MSKDPQTGELTEDEQTEASQYQPLLYGPDVSGLATKNPAVARCCEAFTRAFLASLENEPENEVMARLRAEEAYRQAMPPLHGARNTRDFLACVAHGILVDAIERSRSTRLVYAAQVAYSIRGPKSKTKKALTEPNTPHYEPFQHGRKQP